jgi:uncharacterized protein YbjT (DUF2867 family)
MRLLILGANGKTGTQLVDLALARDHEVTAFVRSPAKVTRRHPLLRCFQVILTARMTWRKRSQGMTSCSPLWAFVRRTRSARTPCSRTVRPAPSPR